MGLNEPDLKRRVKQLYIAAVQSDPVRSLVNTRTVETAELREAGAARDALWEYGDPETTCFDRPALGDVPDDIARQTGEHAFERPFVAELPDCHLVGPQAVTIHDGRYVLENAVRSENMLVLSLLRTLRRGQLPVRRSAGAVERLDTAMSLVGPWCRGYFHWFSEYLPRLEGVVHYAERTGRRPTLVIPGDPPGWLPESLEYVGFDPADWVEWDGTRLTVDRLVVPSVPRGQPVGPSPGGYVHSPRGYRWVSETVRETLGTVDGQDLSDRIYISRRNANERRVVNEDAVVERLEDLGFQSYALEELSYATQVELFATCDAVVAPHGAGLVNTIYAGEPTVVELFGSYVNSCYYTMSEALEYEYACLECEPVGPDLRVDTDRLLDLLEAMDLDA